MMKKDALISVIIPAYNVESTIERCVSCVSSQTYHNLEIIVIDDGSSDKTAVICDSIKSQDNRIIVIHRQHGGPSDARNSGLLVAKGEFIAFVDGDDLINPMFIENMYKLQQENNADIVSCNFTKFYHYDDISFGNVDPSDYNKLLCLNKDCLKEYLDRKTNIKIYHCVWNKFYKRQLFNDIKFDSGRYHEDLFITYKLLRECNCLVATDMPLYYYYKNNKHSICSTYNETNFMDQYDAINEIYTSLKGDKEIKNELSRFIANNSVDIYLLNIKNKKLLVYENRLKSLIFECINSFSLIEKIKIFIKLIFPSLFVKKKKNLLNNISHKLKTKKSI